MKNATCRLLTARAFFTPGKTIFATGFSPKKPESSQHNWGSCFGQFGSEALPAKALSLS
jgi:hypothetical protein